MRMVLIRSASVLALVALPLLSGCGGTREYVVAGLERAPGADATITVERQEGGNFLVQVTVRNLLPPNRMGGELATYAVWFQPSGGNPQRVGNLTYDEGDRAGTMTATTTQAAFDVIVSGEAGADAGAPSEYVVIRTAVESPQ